MNFPTVLVLRARAWLIASFNAGYSSVPGFLADIGGAGFNLTVFFWRLTVFHFLAVSSFVVPGTGKFAGIFFCGLKYGGFVSAVPGTAKFKKIWYF